MSPRGEISPHKELKILCVTIPPRGQFCNKIDSINSLYYTKLLYV